MATEDPTDTGGSRQTNSKDSVTPAQPGDSSDSSRELPTTAERVSESYAKYPDRTQLPLTERDGVSLRRDYTREHYEPYHSEAIREIDDDVTGQQLVARTPYDWGEAVEKMLEDHEDTRRTTINLEKGRPSDPEYAEFSIEAVTRWFASYQMKYYAQMEGWLRELTGGDRPSGGTSTANFDDPHICLLTTSASSMPEGERVAPVDHISVRRSSWNSCYDTLRNTMRSLGYDWQYERRSEPHTGKRGEYGINRCYGHDHIVLVVDGPVTPNDLRPVIEKHVEECEWAGADAHDLDIQDWNANADDVGTVEIKEPEELESTARYVADYASIDPLDLHERSEEYIMWAAAVTAANAKTQSRSDAAGWASTADACKQRYESGQSDQSVDHGESVIRSETRGVDLECAKCGSPHGIDQDQTLTAARVGDQPTAAADGGLDREGELRDQWPSARAFASVGQTPTEKRQRDQIEQYIQRYPDATPTQIMGALGLPPDARRLIEEVDHGVDPTEPVAFERPPEWQVKSVTVGEEEYPASAGTGVEMVETIDYVERILQNTKLGCVNSKGIYWRCERTNVAMYGGRSMAGYLVKHGIIHPEVVDDVVSADRVPDPGGVGTIEPDSSWSPTYTD
jgi:hypothetical protein